MNCQAECCYAQYHYNECRYAECRGAFQTIQNILKAVKFEFKTLNQFQIFELGQIQTFRTISKILLRGAE